MKRAAAVVGFVVVGLILVLVWRIAEVRREQAEQRSAEVQREQVERRKAEVQREQAERRNALLALQTKLSEQLHVVEAEFEKAKRDGEKRIHEATSVRAVAEQAGDRAKEEKSGLLGAHRWTKWWSGSATSKRLEALDAAIAQRACRAHRATINLHAAERWLEKRMAVLATRRGELRNALDEVERRLSDSSPIHRFVALKPSASDRHADLSAVAAVLARPSGVVDTAYPDHRLYQVPVVAPESVPAKATSLFDAVGLRSAGDVKKFVSTLGKDAQATALRWWNDKESGRLVDVRIGCAEVTLDRSVGEATWYKYRYFLAQTDGQCEIAPSSDFRDVFKQALLKEQSKTKGPPAGNPWSSSHVMGLAIDEAGVCQNRSEELPFDFDERGEVIFVRVKHRPNGNPEVLHEPMTRDAIVRKRRQEFAADFRQLVAAGGDVKRWEAEQYERALHELLALRPSMGIYGANVMSFEAGLKAGLVGAYCSVEGRPSGRLGFRPDPLHSEKSIHGSTAECGSKLGGNPQCYRVDRNGKPDCWRGSPAWNTQVEHQRKRIWGERFASLYGPERLGPYLKVEGK